MADALDWQTIAVTFEMEFSAGTWTDVTSDVLGRPAPQWDRGTNGIGFADLVPDPQTFRFALRNDSGNSGGLEGYYSPGHTNARSGFGLDIRVRIRLDRRASSTDTTWVYYLKSIQPESSQKRKRTLCVATDRIDRLMRQRIAGLGVQTDITDKALFTAIVGEITPSITGSQSTVANDTFLYANDVVDDASQTVYDALRKLAESGLSHVFFSNLDTVNDVTFPTSAGEFLRWSSRHTRHSTEFSGAATFDEDHVSLDLIYSTDDLVNIVDCESPIRSVDSDNETVLYSIDTDRPVVPASGSITIWLDFRDPNNEAETVTGTEMQNPVASTDFTMNSLGDGGGSDLTSDHTVTPTFFSSSVKLVVANTGSVNSVITKLQGRGKGIYSFGVKHIRATDSTSVTAHGERQRSFSLHWQSDPNVCQAAADWMLTQIGDDDTPHVQGARLTYIANRSTGLWDKTASGAASDVGNVIHLADSITGLNASGSDFWQIQKQSFEYIDNTVLKVTLLLKHFQPQVGVWKLGATAADALSTDTKLGAW